VTTVRRGRPKLTGVAAQAFMITMLILWLTPIVFALYVALRPNAETNRYGYVSLPHDLTLQNFTDAWTQSDMWRFFWNSVYVTVPAVLLTLFLASMFAYVVSRLSFRFNLPLLMIFTAGNLLPQQVIITPLYRLYLSIDVPRFVSAGGLLYNSYTGLIVINTAFQLGFCIFVLSNYMKSPGQPAGAVRVEPEHDRGRGADRSRSHAGRLRPPPKAVHLRPVPGLIQRLTLPADGTWWNA
jgi:multiple sugar transport system permease protein